MNIILYHTDSPQKSMSKSLTAASQTATAVVRTPINILRPTLRINSAVLLDVHNYVYIEDFDRYYFIEESTIDRTNVCELICRVDVMMSHAGEIKDCDAVFDRTANADAANTDIPDSMIRVTAGHYIDYYNFDNGLVYPERIIMVCNV